MWTHYLDPEPLQCAGKAQKKNLATIRSGPPGTRRAAETVFIMKIVRRDKKGRKQIDEGSAEFQDYLVRFEDINHSWKSKC